MSGTVTHTRGEFLDGLSALIAPLPYLAPGDGPVRVRIFPPTSGVPTERPAREERTMPIRDARPLAARLQLDEHGFELHARPCAFTDFFDDAAVRARYYPLVRDDVRALTGALEVFVFDHNVRSAALAESGVQGVRLPADQAHGDYTERSGPKRKLEVLEQAGRLELAGRRVAFVNLWRPIVGPVQDTPLALCLAYTVSPQDLVATEIQHFGEDNLEQPRHRGEIYSLRYNPAHRWYYFSDMQPHEALLLKCYDSRTDGRARFMPHAAFRNPACPRDFVPRQSIEARTLVVFDEPL
jgi:hypothetical protein